jgi:CelD/BcsL family acetyltransferase involved in cellulose biosynthesis
VRRDSLVTVRRAGALDAALGPSWNALLEESATNTVFQTFEWTASWWSSLGAGEDPPRELLLLIAEGPEGLAGIAPLMVSTQRIFGRKRRVVEFIGTHAADYCDFIARRDAGAARLLLQWLVDHRNEWDLLHLINIAETSPLLALLPGMLGEAGYAVDVHALYQCPTYVFGDRAADERLTRKKIMRSSENKLRRQGELRFTAYRSRPEIETRLEGFFQQHIARWSGTRTPSFFLDARQRAFYRELARRLGEKSWVLFSALRLDDVPVAFHFGYAYGGRIYVIKPTFNPDYAAYAPGLLQIKYLAQYAMAESAVELDFTIGEEPYKFRFTNHTRCNYAARVHAPAMFYGVDRLLSRAKALVKRSPLLTLVGKRLVRPWLGSVSHRMGLL